MRSAGHQQKLHSPRPTSSRFASSGSNHLNFTLFGLVVVVLVLEGLFVVNPAVLKIQQIMREMSKSHDELKVVRQEAGAEQQRAPGLCFGCITRPAGAVAEDPGVQRST